MKSTKQVVAEATQALMAKTPENGLPSAIGLNQFSMTATNELIKAFGGEMPTLHGLVAMGYATARFAAAAVVQTVETREDLNTQIQAITELVATTVRMGIDAAWTHARDGKIKDAPLIVVVPADRGVKA
jgi:hypothetical protein